MLIDRDRTHDYRQIVGDLSALKDFANQSFDWIVCHNVLEYIENKSAVLKEFDRVLKNGGNLSLVKHNRYGRVMQMAVLLNRFDCASDLLDGHSGSAAQFGTIRYYEDQDVNAMQNNFKIVQTYGLRTFFNLQQNQEIQSDPQWQEQMLNLERRVSQIEAFQNIAFFHHLILQKVDTPRA